MTFLPHPPTEDYCEAFKFCALVEVYCAGQKIYEYAPPPTFCTFARKLWYQYLRLRNNDYSDAKIDQLSVLHQKHQS